MRGNLGTNLARVAVAIIFLFAAYNVYQMVSGSDTGNTTSVNPLTELSQKTASSKSWKSYLDSLNPKNQRTN